MYLSDTELYVILILLVAAVKTIWDAWVSSAIFARRSKEKAGSALSNELETKLQRDRLLSFISFAAIVILAGMVFEDGASKNELAMEEIELLNEKVSVLESHFITPDGDPSANLYGMLKSLDSRLSSVEKSGVSNEDVIKLKKDAAELKRLKDKIDKASEYEKQLRIQGDVSIL